MEKNNEKKREQIANVIKKAQKDKAFRKKLLENTNATLKHEGIEVPKGVNVKFLERTKDTYYYILPSDNEVISDQELIKMAGGVGVNCSKSCNRGCF